MKMPRPFVPQVFLFLWCLCIAALLLAQAPRTNPPTPQWQIDAGGHAAFDVASVKANKAVGTVTTNIADRRADVALGAGDSFVPSGGRFVATDAPLILYIQFAYKMSFSELRAFVKQAPPWVYNDRFDIEAKAPLANPTKDQLRLMTQALLAERFHLMLHTEKRRQPVYALVLANAGKTGPQLQRDDAPCTAEGRGEALGQSAGRPAAASQTSGLQLPEMPCGAIFAGLLPSAPGWTRSGARLVSMGAIADWLDSWVQEVDRPVVDRTGLDGTFDFALEFTHQVEGPLPPNVQFDPTGPPFPQALREQLGLKLEATTGPVNVLVLDHIEEPTAN